MHCWWEQRNKVQELQTHHNIASHKSKNEMHNNLSTLRDEILFVEFRFVLPLPLECILCAIVIFIYFTEACSFYYAAAAAAATQYFYVIFVPDLQH